MYKRFYCYVVVKAKETAAVLWFENYNVSEIVTPVDAERFRELLMVTGYPRNKIKFLYEGFTEGFSLQFQGNRQVVRYAPNLKI